MLKLDHVSFSYDQTSVLKDISFSVNPGSCLAIIGESGSGKSSLLKLIYGEHDASKGSITWNNQPILGPKDKLIVGHDFMKYVAQEFDLMPYISVAENIGAFLSNFFAEEKAQRINSLLGVVELQEFANTKVQSLSGGQKQRVALARAIARQPEVILLDEPFSHIDNFKKQTLRRNLFRYLKSNNITCVVATHDKNDVLSFANHIAVLHDQSIIRMSTPEDIYTNPNSPLVAAFFDHYNEINNTLVYAHQLKIDPNGSLKAKVIQNYYQGDCYLIEAEYKNTKIYFNNENRVKTGHVVNLTINK